MNEIIKSRKMEKVYWAVVKELPPKTGDSLRGFLKKNEAKNKSFVYQKQVSGSKEAALDYRVIAHSSDYHLLEVHLKTGRHHQIRAQLADIGSPIKGDIKYGFSRTNPNASIHLHARKIEFIHPVRNTLLTIIADPPEDPLWNYFLENQTGN
jgi:23S rRNA pseudouridine1911/1915/1917 synthase